LSQQFKIFWEHKIRFCYL